MKLQFFVFLLALLVLSGKVVLSATSPPLKSTLVNNNRSRISPLSTSSANSEIHEDVPGYTYRIINSYPHDPLAFTQGLVYADGFLYEGTGRHGRSTLRKVDLETGKILQQLKLPNQFFGPESYGPNSSRLS